LNIAAGVATIDALHEDGLVERSARLGDSALARLQRELGGLEHVGDIRGRGLFIGLELVQDRATCAPDPARAAQAVAELRTRGVIVGRGGRHGNVVKLSPPLIIDENDLATGLQTVADVIA